MTQNTVVVTTLTIVCAAFAFMLAVSMGDAAVNHTLFNTFIDTFKLGAGAVIALISMNRDGD